MHTMTQIYWGRFKYGGCQERIISLFFTFTFQLVKPSRAPSPRPWLRVEGMHKQVLQRYGLEAVMTCRNTLKQTHHQNLPILIMTQELGQNIWYTVQIKQQKKAAETMHLILKCTPNVHNCHHFHHAEFLRSPTLTLMGYVSLPMTLLMMLQAILMMLQELKEEEKQEA